MIIKTWRLYFLYSNEFMINHLAILLSGFSIFSLAILFIAYLFFLPDMRKSTEGKIASSILLISLIALQFGHYLYFVEATPLLEYKAYGLLLIFIPVAFFFFSRVVIFPDINYSKPDLLHFIPSLCAIAIPVNYLAPLGFILGAGYTLWFASLIYKLRTHSARFKFELFFFSLFAIIALFTLALCLSLPYIDTGIFYFAYSISISVSVLLVLCVLLLFPRLLNDLLLITELAYAKSKLSGINTEDKLTRLEQLMTEDKLFQNEDLKLNTVAEQLDLSAHQLSELINTNFDYSFPRYVREHRVREAKDLLINEPNSSVLSISMMTGFKSQSNFYTAFKETTGISPGQFRKTNNKSA